MFVECPACHFAKAVLAFTYRTSIQYFFCSRCQHVWNTPAPPTLAMYDSE
jgi:hypothetical protein